jgi:hypothetical protein
MAKKGGKSLTQIVLYEMKGSTADKKFRKIQEQYGTELNKLYARRDEKKREAEESLKDFLITF